MRLDPTSCVLGLIVAVVAIVYLYLEQAKRDKENSGGR